MATLLIGRTWPASAAPAWAGEARVTTADDDWLRDHWPPREIVQLAVGEKRCVGLPFARQGDNPQGRTPASLEEAIATAERYFERAELPKPISLVMARLDYDGLPAYNGRSEVFIGAPATRVGFRTGRQAWEAADNGDDEPEDAIQVAFRKWRGKGALAARLDLFLQCGEGELFEEYAGVKLGKLEEGIRAVPLSRVRRTFEDCKDAFVAVGSTARPALWTIESYW